MKLVSWNCKFGFTNQKAEFIKKHNADLYIIQECCEKDLANNTFLNKAFFCDEVDSKYGVGLFSDKFNFQILPEHNMKFRFIVPYKIFNDDFNFVLFSVWTKDKDENKKKMEYTEQTWNAINFEGYKKYLQNTIILVGDFNSNNYWDKTYIAKNIHSHNNIIDKLKEFNIESVYHKFNNCIDGNEKDATLLWQMDINKKFHIDYCFVSNDYKINNINIGSLDDWKENKLSDHCPLIIEIDKY